MTNTTGQIVMDFSPATRKSHPDTSRGAEKQVTESGRRLKHSVIILRCLRQHNGSTTKELAGYLAGMLRYDQIWRRMGDLQHNDYIVRNERIRRDGNCTWWIK